jgi:Protein of unknown function (DUF4238)
MHPKRQHYVPKVLLRHFCIPATPQIYVYDKKTDETFKTNVDNVAVENGFYDFQIEGIDLTIEPNLQKIEDLIKGRLCSLVDNASVASLSLEDKTILGILVAVQMLRSKHTRLASQAIAEQMRERIREMGQDPDTIPQLRELTEDDEKMLTARHLEHTMPQMVPHLVDKIWLLFRTDATAPFYISDNPVTLNNENDMRPRGNLGIAVQGIEVYLPLTPTFTLALYCKSHESLLQESYDTYKRLQRADPVIAARSSVDPMFMEALHVALETGRPATVPGIVLARLNALQVAFSSRYVYSQLDDFRHVRAIVQDDNRQRQGILPKLAN